MGPPTSLVLGLCVVASLVGNVLASVARPRRSDPCAAIASKRWVSPKQARACLSHFPLEYNVKDNILEVAQKTLAFHTSVNYQIKAPFPFDRDVRVDLHRELKRVSDKEYDSEFAFHLDVYNSFRRTNDGHCGLYNYCYDSAFMNYIPLPLVLLTAPDGTQNVHVAPEAFKVATAEFGKEIKFWQNALPGKLKGKLASLSGAKVLKINGKSPFVAVNGNAKVAGGYQAFSTRQNTFFSSYQRGRDGWYYVMGQFAMQPHPLIDKVKLSVQRVNSSSVDTFTLPYRAKSNKRFKDGPSYYSTYCKASSGTNGIDLYDRELDIQAYEAAIPPIAYFEQQPATSRGDARQHATGVLLDSIPLSDAALPEHLQPRLPALEESYTVGQFYMLKDRRTGVLALGSFKAPDYSSFGTSLLEGLQKLKEQGATRLIVDVTNNGGGTICIAHWLHRIIIGPKDTTEPQAGLDTTFRAGPLARAIVKKIAGGVDPDRQLAYNPRKWHNATNHRFPDKFDWMKDVVDVTINGRRDAFSQRLGKECQPFRWDPPEEGLFDPKNVAIVSNGRCGSSCALFSVTMAKKEGVKTVVVGGRSNEIQEYCGMVGGQSTGFEHIDTQIKTAKLKGHRLAPPDLVANVHQGITFRLAFGVDNPRAAEEWQPHEADFNLPLTMKIVNNPVAIWDTIAKNILS